MVLNGKMINWKYLGNVSVVKRSEIWGSGVHVEHIWATLTL